MEINKLTSKKIITTTNGECLIEFFTQALEEKKYSLIINNIYYVDAATTSAILYLKLWFTPTNLIDTQKICFLEFRSFGGSNYYSINNQTYVGTFQSDELDKTNKIEIYDALTDTKLAVAGRILIDYLLC